MMRRTVLAVVLALATLPVGALTAYALPPKHIQGNQTIPVYDYASAIREVVWVESSVDSDSEPGPDRIAVDIVRPVDPDNPGLQVPAIVEASPYYTLLGRGNELEKKLYLNPNDPTSPVVKMPLYYDNYFVPRGYAFLGVDLSGSTHSTGCLDVGGKAEVLGAKAVIDWLTGAAVAHNAMGQQVFATWFSGKAGMIGKSWDGAMVTGVAATGVPGLATVVPISAVTSWYDYERLNGAVRSNVSSTVGLHDTYTSRPPASCSATRASLVANNGLDYSPFWVERDYVATAANIKASVFVVHGMNDLNVKSSNFGRLWDQLAAAGVPRKLWLSQEQHVDPFDFRRALWVDTLHRWFDQWLQGLDTGIMNEPQATVERAADTWVDLPEWPPAGTTSPVYYLRPGNGITGELSTAGPNGGSMAITDLALTESTATTGPQLAKLGRWVFLTPALAQDVHLAGSATVTVRMQSTLPTATLTARLVDYGNQTRVSWESGQGITTGNTEDCWGAATAADDACYKKTTKNVVNTGVSVLSRGWLDLAHRGSLSSPTGMPALTWQTVTLRLAATDQIVKAGHQLGLVISSTDSSWTTTAATASVLTFDLGRCILRLPTAPN
ncbi:MAG: Xaa-Pro dipeptidyl-peptidase [Nocardioidaceae bacterium]|nr:Xaa-Pro dipeptidyl-peptidase [Nocardioidaceae bacterium]